MQFLSSAISEAIKMNLTIFKVYKNHAIIFIVSLHDLGGDEEFFNIISIF